MTHINQRRDTAANWTTTNPVLHLGEVGWETDTLFAKLGDGVTAWNALPYAIQPGPVTSVNGQDGDVVLDKAAVGLSNVDNTNDMGKPVSVAQAAAIDAKVVDSIVDGDTTRAPSRNAVFDALALLAPLASPTFTGDPKAPTPATTDNDTSIATTAFVRALLTSLGITQPIQFGKTTVELTAANNNSEAVVFPTAFTGAGTPVVIAVIGSNSATYCAGVGGVTNTGCNVLAFHKDAGSTATVTLTVHWVALK